MAASSPPDLGFVEDTKAPPTVPDVGFVEQGSPASQDTSMDQRYGTIRAPNMYEKAAQAWSWATHGLFSAGPHTRPAHVEGVKTEWGDLPHVYGGMLPEMLINPGNILSAVFGAKAVPAIGKAAGKAFGAYMLAQTAKSVPGLAREVGNKDVSGAQKAADVGGAAIQATLGYTGLKGPSLPHVERSVNEFGNALRSMPEDEAGRILAASHGATPKEMSNMLLQEAAKAKDPAVVEHLSAASRQFAQIDQMQPEPVAKLNDRQLAFDELKRVMAPATRGPQAAIAAGALREMGADLAQRTDRATAALEDSSKILMKMPTDARWDAVDRIERGLPQTNPDLQQFADTTREIFDSKRDEIRALGTGKLDDYIDDYFVHIWKDPEDAAVAFKRAASKAPIEGSKSFLKQRTIPTIAEGRALGLEPASTNPVDLVLLGARQMDKYLLGQKWIAEMKDKNLVKFVAAGSEAPEGYEKLNDKIATVYGPREGAVSLPSDTYTMVQGENEPLAKATTPGDVTVHGRRIMGEYYAPNAMAQVANNYLSPGLRRYATYRAFTGAGNALNRFQLGLSAFHLGFTSLDTATSKLALALEYGTEGKPLKAAGKVAQIPVAPVQNLLQGDRVLKEWMNPGTQGAEMGKVVDAIRQGGGRAKMDQLYQTTITKNMKNAWGEGKYGSAIWRAPFAVLEQVSKPLMEYIVPRQKLGVAADLMRKEMDNLPANATDDQMRAAFGKVWDSVDNRMGQMVYDNLFWNKTVKDLSMATVRSVGWDLGTIRELGGGIRDSATAFRRSLGTESQETEGMLKANMTPAEAAEFTHRMAYMIALPVMTGLLGATYQYMKTGKGPDELRDYFFPKTGEKDPQGRDVRLSFPTYMKDVYHYAHDFPQGTMQTIAGKMHPLIGATWEMLSNKDYYGRDIRNADDPIVKQMMDEVKFAADQFLPMGVRNLKTSMAAGQTKGEEAANFVGVTRAPAWIGETDAEQLAGKLAGEKFKGLGTPDSQLVAKKQQIQSALRNGSPEDKVKAKQTVADMVEGKELTRPQARNLVRGTDHTYLENAISHLDAKEAIRVFKQATPEERESIREAVKKKLIRAHLPSEDKKALRAELEKLSPDKSGYE